jgi:hypothetical protein
MHYNSEGWDAFGRDVAKCINDINCELQKMPRKERMALFREARKWMRWSQKPNTPQGPLNKKNTPIPQAPGQKRKGPNLWKPRK